MTPKVYFEVQKACEARLEAAEHWLTWAMDAEDDEGGFPEEEAPQLAGEFCGCVTCVVREVLDAARPYLPQLVLAEHEETIQ